MPTGPDANPSRQAARATDQESDAPELDPTQATPHEAKTGRYTSTVKSATNAGLGSVGYPLGLQTVRVLPMA